MSGLPKMSSLSLVIVLVAVIAVEAPPPRLEKRESGELPHDISDSEDEIIAPNRPEIVWKQDEMEESSPDINNDEHGVKDIMHNGIDMEHSVGSGDATFRKPTDEGQSEEDNYHPFEKEPAPFDEDRVPLDNDVENDYGKGEEDVKPPEEDDRSSEDDDISAEDDDKNSEDDDKSSEDDDKISEDDDRSSEDDDKSFEDEVPKDNDEDALGPLSGGFIFDNPFFNMRQVSKYFQQLERALEHVFHQSIDEATLLNGTYANTTEEEVEIRGKKYLVQKSIIKGKDNNSTIYIEALSSMPKMNGRKVLKDSGL